ncbi:cold-shock protein [Breoghania sp.]|uniref:cold-shock protein n=1 Tax=Breoghania sp. TaxID=2065378 RepID=UPI002626A504|nr:cold-shock protein [Breoghania sp.]MDJ0931541.1 cold-shock protein [Breoghania sp.]
MADWRSRKGCDPDMDDEPVRRNKGRRGHGRGSRDFDSRQGFGGPIYGAEPPGRNHAPREDYGGGYGDRDDYGDYGGYESRGRGGHKDNGGYAGRRGPSGADRGASAEHSGDDRPSGGFRPRSDTPRQERQPAERGPRQTGTVKFFKSDKGFGFITPDEGAVDVFVHISAVERSGLSGLESGQRLSFATEPDRRGKGPKAVELQVEESAG